MGAYTLGPWQIHPNGLRICATYGKPGMDDSQLIPVSLLGCGVNRDANARLIAAAPEMAGLLAAVATRLGRDEWTSEVEAKIDVLLTKIRG